MAVDRAPSGAGPPSEEGVTLCRVAGSQDRWEPTRADFYKHADSAYEVAEFVPAASLAGVKNEKLRVAATGVLQAWGARDLTTPLLAKAMADLRAALSTPEEPDAS